MDIMIGADPELFFTTGGGRLRSAAGIVPGTKAEPFVVDKGALQVDGMAAEFNIDPAKTSEEFVTNIKTVMTKLEGYLPKGYKFGMVSSGIFYKDVLDKQSEEALELGCDPDYSAYTLEANPRPVPHKAGFRTCAGHLHVGFLDKDNLEQDVYGINHMIRCSTLIKQMDRYVGLPLRLLERGPSDRRTLYGKAGAFRPKAYGCEYRTPSNEWLKSDATMTLAFDATKAAVEDLLEGYRAEDEIKNPEAYINSYHTHTPKNARSFARVFNKDVSSPRLKDIFQRVEALCEKEIGDKAGPVDVYRMSNKTAVIYDAWKGEWEYVG